MAEELKYQLLIQIVLLSILLFKCIELGNLILEGNK